MSHSFPAKGLSRLLPTYTPVLRQMYFFSEFPIDPVEGPVPHEALLWFFTRIDRKARPN
ncbi:hypothetical protein SAMN05192553_104258 [Cyclobacterium xiamenense]|uniref:Uncharacterized protein n=1 Tax=Cyclobacterium xiamenense TaxID=1297121 RepID=A0A1H6Z8K0_9BACT|nr:hypothetical protein SAMN05192553_104258 [Cyclobacterium xiamenense]